MEEDKRSYCIPKELESFDKLLEEHPVLALQAASCLACGRPIPAHRKWCSETCRDRQGRTKVVRRPRKKGAGPDSATG